MDLGFMTDSTIYYNLVPSPPDTRDNEDKRRSTFPRKQPLYQDLGRSTSCPTSPEIKAIVRGGKSAQHNARLPPILAESISDLLPESTKRQSEYESFPPILAPCVPPPESSKSISDYVRLPPILDESPSGSMDNSGSFGKLTSQVCEVEPTYENAAKIMLRKTKNFLLPWKKKKDMGSVALGYDCSDSCGVYKNSGDELLDSRLPVPVPSTGIITVENRPSLNGSLNSSTAPINYNAFSNNLYPLPPYRLSNVVQSSCSSSTSLNEENASISSTEICGGITYTRPSQGNSKITSSPPTSSISSVKTSTSTSATINSLKSEDTLVNNHNCYIDRLYESSNPLETNDSHVERKLSEDWIEEGKFSPVTVEGNDFSSSLNSLMREWRSKARWLARKIQETNTKQDGFSLDVALLYHQSDGLLWAEFLVKEFEILLDATEEDTFTPSIEAFNVEAMSSLFHVPEVQASCIREAKLQVILMSPEFLTFLHAKSDLLLGKLFKPERTLALMLGVTKEIVCSDSVAVSTMNSFELWRHLVVRDRDKKFVDEVQEESLRILLAYEGFNGSRVAGDFSVCPRKIMQNHCNLYIHLKSPLDLECRNCIQITVDVPQILTCVILNFRIHNPYTLSFDVPETFLTTSCFLKIRIVINDVCLGFRQVKCEGPMEVIRNALTVALNPVDIMCQSLNIGSRLDELDNFLSSRLYEGLPPSMAFVQAENKDLVSAGTTWLHFGASYNLPKVCYSILDTPGGEQLLAIRDTKGCTPARLALKAGNAKLAQDLENATLVASLLPLSCYRSVPLEETSEKCAPNGSYSDPPRPRIFRQKRNAKYLRSYSNQLRRLPDVPCPDNQESNPSPIHSIYYDSPPSKPRPVKQNSSPDLSQMVYANLMYVNSSIEESTISVEDQDISYTDPNKYPNNLPLSTVAECNDQYMDMSGAADMEEYQKEVNLLVTAWTQRDGAKSFLDEYQRTISKFAENKLYKMLYEKKSHKIPEGIDNISKTPPNMSFVNKTEEHNGAVATNEDSNGDVLLFDSMDNSSEEASNGLKATHISAMTKKIGVIKSKVGVLKKFTP